MNQAPKEVGGPGAHMLSILLRAPEKHQGPRNRLCKALRKKNSTILWLPFLHKFLFFSY